MGFNVYRHQDMPREVRHAIVRELSRRVVDIVTASHPEPVLGAEIEAQITERDSTVVTDDGDLVSISDGALVYARYHAVRHGGLEEFPRGNQVSYRLSDSHELDNQ